MPQLVRRLTNEISDAIGGLHVVRHDVERWHLPGRPAQQLLYLTQDLLVVLVVVLEILSELMSLPGILQALESVSDWDGVQRSDELVPKS